MVTTANLLELKLSRQIMASGEIVKVPFESIVMKGIGLPVESILKIRLFWD